MFRIGFECGGYGGSVEDGFAHVDGDGSVGIHDGDDGSGESVDTVGFGCCIRGDNRLEKEYNYTYDPSKSCYAMLCILLIV